MPLNEGLNRFSWDVRHQAGLSAPPGSYQVRLRGGDITQTQPLKVLVDPRVAAEVFAQAIGQGMASR